MIPLDAFDTILFDLNGTLAEGHDRFGPEEDYHATYRSLGGRALDPAAVRAFVDDTLGTLLPRYRAGPWEGFPALVDCVSAPHRFPSPELERLLETVAVHECGRVPDARRTLLRRLAGSHRLGLVSDLWAPAERCRRYLEDAGIAALFGCLVFSCEHGAVKPARRLFEGALAALEADPARTLFVGDDAARDVAGAAALGLSTVWIGDPDLDSEADWVLRDVLELAA